MPSQRLKLSEQGYSDPTAYDFDLAVKTLASAIDAALHETIEVEVPERKRARKGMTWDQKPKYSLRELLFEDRIAAATPAATNRDEAAVTAAIASLPTAQL